MSHVTDFINTTPANITMSGNKAQPREKPRSIKKCQPKVNLTDHHVSSLVYHFDFGL